MRTRLVPAAEDYSRACIWRKSNVIEKGARDLPSNEYLRRKRSKQIGITTLTHASSAGSLAIHHNSPDIRSFPLECLFLNTAIMLTIYHNPRCSKSREALALAEEFASRNGLQLEVVEYLKTPPSIAQLLNLQRQLGGTVRDMIRDNEDDYTALDLANADDTGLLAAIAVNPKLLQRPIVVYKDRAAIGRPPERLNDLLAEE